MHKWIVVTVVGLAFVQAADAGKPDQRIGRSDEAYTQCASYLHDNAKDPDSFVAETKYTSKLATFWTAFRAGKNQIIIYMDAKGKNDYGAVLKHSYTCWAACSPGKPCSVDGAVEDSE